MKKLLSIIVVFAMMLASVLTMIPVFAENPEGTAISSAAEFAAMTADGQYYLAKDITLTEAYENDFTGKFDGNGKTITLADGAVTAFKSIKGATVSRLTLKASYETTQANALGVLANKAAGNFENINVIANVKVLAAAKSFYGGAGLIVGEVDGDTTFLNCTTDGSIVIETVNHPGNDDSSLNYGIGGFAGRILKGIVTFKDSTNRAFVNTLQPGMPSGGFVGETDDGQKWTVTFDGCVNYGEIVTYGVPSGHGNAHTGAGGIIGNALGIKAAESSFVFRNCRNYGYIHQNEECGKVTGVGGMIGRAYSPAKLTLEGCVNSGRIESFYNKVGWATPGGMIGTLMTYGFGWSGSHPGIITLNNCVNLGEVVAVSTAAGGMIGVPSQFNVKECQLTLENCVNYANITGFTDVSGMITRVGEYGFSGLTMKNCVNYGDITSTGNDKESCAAGMVTVIVKEYGSRGFDTPNPTIIENCVNFGKIKAEGNQPAAGIIISVDTNDTTIKNCINLGEIISGKAAEIMPKSDKTITAEGNIFTGNATTDYGTAVEKDDAEAKATAIATTVPGNPIELDSVIAGVVDYQEADYKEGWEDFAEALSLAITLVNRASSAADIAQMKTDLETAIAALREIDEVSLTALNLAIEAADELAPDEDKYTPGTWKLMKKALEEANAVLNNESAKQSAVNAAADKLNAAIAALEEKADFEALDAEIAKYTDLVEAEYMSATWQSFKAALDAAVALKENSNATNSDVGRAVEKIRTTFEALEKRATAEELATVIAEADSANENYKREDYTVKTYKAITDAVRNIKALGDAEEVSAKQVAAASEALKAAIAALEKKGDLTALKALIESLTYEESDFTPESFAAYTKALEDAKDGLLPQYSLSQAEVDALTEQLQKAIEELVRWADYTEINKIITEIDSLKEADYTAESWSALKALLADVETLKSDRNATEKDSDELYAKLKAAKEALVPVSNGGATEPSGNDGNSATDKTEKKGCKSFVATSVAVVAVVTLLGTAVVLKKKEN